jgi:hypothetical protein
MRASSLPVGIETKAGGDNGHTAAAGFESLSSACGKVTIGVLPSCIVRPLNNSSKFHSSTVSRKKHPNGFMFRAVARMKLLAAFGSHKLAVASSGYGRRHSRQGGRDGAFCDNFVMSDPGRTGAKLLWISRRSCHRPFSAMGRSGASRW